MQLQCPDFECGAVREFSKIELELYLDDADWSAARGSVIAIDWRCPACGGFHSSSVLQHEIYTPSMAYPHHGNRPAALSFLDLIAA
ncbi:hypothetical protein [Pararhodobacter sp. CCB-MM2]|uniref:hypothetical protein n=1 Tax=Pararhodobacter sp. CCB-MM2 TaxID=1786003 RepID=UPI0008297591|nr:hypothetical protein [Pararhodobacter sp. CCB-MM2]